MPRGTPLGFIQPLRWGGFLLRGSWPRLIDHCLDQMIELTAALISPFDAEQLDAAKAAYRRYGRGTRHAANLNMGDCFAYALAKTKRLPLLFKGDDFIHTDVERGFIDFVLID
jgi:ribonuclease VapC